MLDNRSAAELKESDSPRGKRMELESLKPLSPDEEKIVAACRRRGELRHAAFYIRRHRFNSRARLDADALDPVRAPGRLGPVDPFDFGTAGAQRLERF